MGLPHVVYVESNVKGGVRARLGPKTFVVGGNYKGKSAVTNAIELAVSGRVSDIQGRRDVGKEIELMSLAPLVGGKRMELFSRAVFSDGSEAVWRAKSGKKASHQFPPFVDPEAALPLRPVFAAVIGSVETARKFFLGHAVGIITDKDVLDRIPPPLHALYKRASLGSSSTDVPPVDRLLSALERAKAEAGAASRRAKAHAEAAVSNASGLAPLPTQAEEAALAQSVKEAEEKLVELQRRAAQVEALQGATERQEAARVRWNAARVAVEDARARHQQNDLALQATPLCPPIDRSVSAVIVAIRAHAEDGVTGCYVCANPGPVDFKARLKAFEDYLGRVLEMDRAYQAARKAFDETFVLVRQAEAEVAQAKSAKDDVEALLARGPQEVPSAERIAQAEALVAGLRDRQRENDVLRASWGASDKARASAKEEEESKADWEKLVEACQQAVLKLLDTGVSGFKARVQRFLPPQFEYELQLRDGARSVFQFGLAEPGGLRTALSGVEWAVVIAAMAEVCRRPDKYAVLIPDDRAFDPENLYAALESFGSASAQVVFPAPIWPARRGGVSAGEGSTVIAIPAGWGVVNVDDGQHQSADPPLLAPQLYAR